VRWQLKEVQEGVRWIDLTENHYISWKINVQKRQGLTSEQTCLFYGQPTKPADGSYVITYAEDSFTAVPRTVCG